MKILDKIQKENDIKKVNPKYLPNLAEEIRQFLIEKVSKTGGHLASNLGAVELIMALHLCMDFPDDKLIFDVGHQSYTHKILTGRAKGFDHLREYGGMSGFPKTAESACDAFNTGHSSTSISAAMGFAVARDMKGGNEKIAAVIGDGSLTGGMAYEAINTLGQLKTGLVIILNDNDMSIDKNVGGLSKYLNGLRVGSAYNDFKSGVENSLLGTKTGEKVARTLKRSKDSIKQLFVPGMFFEELGVTYVGPIDGHNISQMVTTINKAFKLNKPIIIHVKTKKGKGYVHAEKHPDYFHGVMAFDKKTGKTSVLAKKESYTDVFGDKLLSLGRVHEDIVAITAAMSLGTGTNKFGEVFPNRMFDVGIAEQHAVTFAAGMASAGMVPVVAIYSSFLQRAYDQMLHDVCLQKLHVIFAIDRSGIVGQDGDTHQGIYDTSYLSHLPGMTVLAPKNGAELQKMLEYAYFLEGPVAIKYPRGASYTGLEDHCEDIVYNKNEIIKDGSRVCMFACGNMVEQAMLVGDKLKQDGIDAMIVNARFLSAIDVETLKEALSKCDIIVSMEENISKGGYGELLFSELARLHVDRDYKLLDCSISEDILPHGEVSRLRKELAIDADGMYERIKELL